MLSESIIILLLYYHLLFKFKETKAFPWPANSIYKVEDNRKQISYLGKICSQTLL